MNNNRFRYLVPVFLAISAMVAACATPAPPVIDKLDENTGVTVTYSRTPFVFSPSDKVSDDSPVEFVQIGAIEINTMGSLRYYLWLGITEPKYLDSAEGHPQGFETIVFDLDGDQESFNVLGWSHQAIGTSEPVYEKLFNSTRDAYYEVSLDQISMMLEATEISLRTADPAGREYTPYYRIVAPYEDLAEFRRVVLE